MTRDELLAEVERRQRARLDRSVLLFDTDEASNTSKPAPPSPWAHIPIHTLFERDGNTIRVRGDGRVETGHEPHHSSKSGACVLINPKTGFWWCRSCGKKGDAVAYIMQREGISYNKAAELLAAEFSAPKAKAGWKPKRQVYVVEL